MTPNAQAAVHTPGIDASTSSLSPSATPGVLVSRELAVYLLLGAQAVVFTAALASGKIPDVVALAFRALLTL